MNQFFRIVIILVGLWLIVRLVKRFLAKYRPGDPERKAISDDVVPCARCGVYIPRSEAVHAQGKAFCSQAHSEAER